MELQRQLEEQRKRAMILALASLGKQQTQGQSHSR
jgi:hypothetical protein